MNSIRKVQLLWEPRIESTLEVVPCMITTIVRNTTRNHFLINIHEFLICNCVTWPDCSDESIGGRSWITFGKRKEEHIYSLEKLN